MILIKIRLLDYLCGSDHLLCVSVGASTSLLPSAGEHSNTWQQTSKPSLLYWSIRGTTCTYMFINVLFRGRMLAAWRGGCCCAAMAGWLTQRMLHVATRWNHQHVKERTATMTKASAEDVTSVCVLFTSKLTCCVRKRPLWYTDRIYHSFLI